MDFITSIQDFAIKNNIVQQSDIDRIEHNEIFVKKKRNRHLKLSMNYFLSMMIGF